jgi:flavin-dependent dehydrogenase
VQRARVAIVGGGPAGISTALFLAHAAPSLVDDVLVLEKETYPREKFCAGAIGARADKLLGSIGLVIDVPSVPIGGIAFRAMGSTVEVREAAAGRVVRRIEFDHALAKAARDRGIRIVEGAAVTGVTSGRDGVVVSTNTTQYRADIVVGADGVGSVVRRALRIAATPYSAQAIEVDTEPVAGDVARELLLFDVADRRLAGYYWDFPTVVDCEHLVCRGVYYLRTQAPAPVEIRTILEERLAEKGLTLNRYAQKRYAERGYYFSGALASGRVLLVGEAAGIDPVTGEGIAQAIQYGATAGAYLAVKTLNRDFDCTDWPKHVRSAPVGRDLLLRTLALQLFYGVHRASVERFLLETPDFIQVGLQHFSGKRWSRAALTRGAWAALKASARALVSPEALST